MANLTISMDDQLLRRARVRAAEPLLTEDLQDGVRFGDVRVENSFT